MVQWGNMLQRGNALLFYCVQFCDARRARLIKLTGKVWNNGIAGINKISSELDSADYARGGFPGRVSLHIATFNCAPPPPRAGREQHFRKNPCPWDKGVFLINKIIPFSIKSQVSVSKFQKNHDTIQKLVSYLQILSSVFPSIVTITMNKLASSWFLVL